MQTVTAGRNNMPSFRSAFTPEQIRDVSAYVRADTRRRVRTVTQLSRSAAEKARLAVALGAFICLAGCQAPASNVQQDESAVRQVFENYLKSVNAADLALGSEIWMQSPDAVAVTPFGRFQGWDQIRDEVYVKFLQQSLTERDLQPSNVSIHTMGDSAWLAFDWAFKGKMATGQPIESKGWESHVYQRTDRGCKDRALALFGSAAPAARVTRTIANFVDE